MKKFITILLLAFLTSGMNGQSELNKVYRFDIKEEIAPPIWRKTKKAIEEAHLLECDLILINMNTYGGQVDMADSIRTKILNSQIPVYVLIENNAASAGALISLACDSIYMQPGSTIGAATVVNQEGTPVPDKYQSYMRKKMRATAEQNGRNPDMAEAMVDPDKVVEGISDSGKVLTLTVNEAIEYQFCEAKIKSNNELFVRLQIDTPQIIEQELTVADIIIGWLVNPMISGILIMVIVGGIYFELQSPGIGFPLIAAIIAGTLYFAPLYLEGLADNWEILIFIIGIILIALEIFVIPGFGVAGISGIILAIAGLTLSLIGNVGFDFEPVQTDEIGKSFSLVVISVFLSGILSIYLASRFIKSKAFGHLVLNTTLNSADGYVSANLNNNDLVGSEGIAFTVLRPSGKVKVNDQIYDATAEIGFINKGSKIKVIKLETSQLFVVQIS
jgi:membrane-bound serine protease (ClpP class)